MASCKTSDKVLCIVCNKGRGSFKCEGCSQTFCPKHSIDHRNELNKQFEGIETQHDQIKQTIIQHIENPHQHLLMKKINQWEKGSLNKIRQKAEEIRNELLENATKHTNDLKKQLETLCNELRQARDDDDFIETDLRKWTKKLGELKINLDNPVNINIREDSTPLVNNIYVGALNEMDIFERVCHDARIKENGRVVVKTGSKGHTEIRGKKEYLSGIHVLRFQVEKLEKNGWIFFGTISKSESMQKASFFLASSYGWSNMNQTYLDGRGSSKKKTIEIIENDTIRMVFNCDERKIGLTNERSNETIEMSIDINKCPFPWQLHLNIENVDTQVRIIGLHD